MESSQAYPSHPSSVPTARAAVRNWMAETPRIDDAEMIVSELATNALRHGPVGGMTVTVSIEPGWARIAVMDGGVGEWHPEPSTPADDSETGRGLGIVHELASKLGQDVHPGGQTIWAELTWPVEAGP